MIYGYGEFIDISDNNMITDHEMKQRLLNRFPQLDECSFDITHKWIGTMGYTIDGYPIIGKLSGSCYICGGYNGDGMPIAFNSGRIIAKLLTGQIHKFLERVSPLRFVK
eukprot:TRINITY_DN9103_c0_g2_i4.p1 TRINITY_DN9103_c0_g2~~TRINITY_DN9103_c0_g2_i4.p1  ORF type:complete len:109 (-),score=20.91 TRINITY_DN9103_c0_g2_i4:16-342(-)